MSMDIFEQWNSNTDLVGLQKDIEEAKNNTGGDFEPVPHGQYEVKLESLELKATKKDKKPMMVATFVILAGKYKKSKLWYNQVIQTGKQIHFAKEFLKSLDTGVDIEFVDYKQFRDLVMDVMEAVEEDGLEYALLFEDNNGYDKYTIKEVFTE